MNHLTLVKSPTEKPSVNERLRKENETEEHFLNAFDEIIEGVKKQKIPFHSHEVGRIENGHKGVENRIAAMPDNSACYIEVLSPDADGNSRHLLVVNRHKDDESVVTFVSVKTSATEVKTIRMYQERSDKSTGYNNQLDVTYDPETVNITDYIYQSRIGDLREIEDTHREVVYDRKSRYKRTEKALQLVDNLVDMASAGPIEEAIPTSITEETDRIKAKVRGRSRMRAFGSAVVHFPDFYRQQRHAA